MIFKKEGFYKKRKAEKKKFGRSFKEKELDKNYVFLD